MLSNEFQKKLKQLGFLVVMILIVSTITYVSMSLRSKYLGDVKETLQTDFSKTPTQSETVAQQVQYEPEPFEGPVPINPNTGEEYGTLNDVRFELLDGGEAVLAAGDSSGVAGCDDANAEGCVSFTIPYQPVCAKAPVSFSVAGEGSSGSESPGGISVSKNAAIEIWKVTSPLPILSGKETIDTTAYSISYDSPNFYSGVKQVREALVAGQYVTPGDDKAGLVAAAAGADTEDFSVHVGLDWGAGIAEEDTIFKELDSACPEIQPSDPNPDPSQKVAQYVMNNSAVPGQPIEPREYGNPPCIDASTLDHLAEADVYEMCANQRSAFTGTIGAVIQAAKWAECAVSPQKCVQQEIVGLLIDAPYGANHKCNDGFCTDQFFDHSIAKTVVPGEIEGMTDGLGDPDDPTISQHYITTPCKIRVVDNVHNGIYDIPCIWDLSPYKAQYDLEVHQRFPDDETLPSFEEYWDLVMDEGRRRGQLCSGPVY